MTMYKLKEVAEILHCSERTLYRWIKDGTLKAVKIGSQWRVSEEEVKRLQQGK